MWEVGAASGWGEESKSEWESEEASAWELLMAAARISLYRRGLHYHRLLAAWIAIHRPAVAPLFAEDCCFLSAFTVSQSANGNSGLTLVARIETPLMRHSPRHSYARRDSPDGRAAGVIFSMHLRSILGYLSRSA